MKRIFTILLMICICFTAVFPVTAYAADTETPIGFSDSGNEQDATATPTADEGEGDTQPEDITGEDITMPDDTPEADQQDTGDDAQEHTPGNATDDTQEETPGENPGLTDGTEVGVSCETPQISLFSGFVGEDNEYYTRIRLTVTDRQGKPLSGVVYGLYDMNRQLVEYLVTDAYGEAISGDVSVYSDYYLEEITPPTGYAPNTERRDIILTEICAPSLVGVIVEYDPIMGNIKVIKTDEYQNPLPGAGFYVYNADTWSLVDTIVTGEDGSATTIDLPYGRYELYEYLVPDGFDGDGGYYMAMIETDGETSEVYVTNYQSRAYVSVYKTGNDGRVIQGAVYSIYKVSAITPLNNGDGLYGEWVEDITTGSDGRAYSSALVLGDYYLVEKSVPAGYKLDDTPHHFTLSYSWQTVTIDIVNERAGEPGRVKVVKTDENENPLNGVVFGLYRTWDGKKLAELTTGPDGTAESEPLIPDDYYLVELSGKDGYDMVAGQTSFTIGESGTTVIVVVVNPKTRVFGKVRVTKEDDAGNFLSGVRFGLYCGKGNLLQEMITGENGTATSGVLNAGDYYLVELSGLPGYVPDTQQYPFTITENGKTVSVTVTNPRVTGGVRVIKTGEDGEPLPGVVFGIFKNGEQIAELTTGADGTAVSGLLYYGAYELRELSTVEGYELLAVAVPFSVLEDGVIIDIPVTNPLIYGGVHVLKTDENGAPLSGAVFGLYNEREQLIAELTTAADGTAEISGLVMGGYYLLEHTAPEGFAPTDEAIPFTVTTQGEVIEKTVVNSAGRGTLRVTKTGENDEPLPGVAFDIYRASDDEKAGEIITDESGVAEIELPLGGYYLMETHTVMGYMLPESGFSFTLTEHGATAVLSIQNQREPESLPGAVRLLKLAEDTQEPLPGAVFGVYEAINNEKLGELITGADGAASLSLPAGGYYLIEQTAPEGFVLDESRIDFIVQNDETVELTVTNTPVPPVEPDPPTTGQIRLIKKDEGTDALLKDAVFGVYEAGTDIKVAELTTGADGTATSGELPAGSFYLLERTAPSGYKLSTEKTGVTVKAGKIVEVTVYNAAQSTDNGGDTTGHVRIIKQAEGTKERLSGAVFGIYRTSNDVKIAEITTDSDGVAVYELSPGDFYLRELKAPSGFLLNSEKTGFTITAGVTRVITVTNEPEETDTGNVRLIKEDERSKVYKK